MSIRTPSIETSYSVLVYRIFVSFTQNVIPDVLTLRDVQFCSVKATPAKWERCHCGSWPVMTVEPPLISDACDNPAGLRDDAFTKSSWRLYSYSWRKSMNVFLTSSQWCCLWWSGRTQSRARSLMFGFMKLRHSSNCSSHRNTFVILSLWRRKDAGR